jgi:hypothetical protein
MASYGNLYMCATNKVAIYNCTIIGGYYNIFFYTNAGSGSAHELKNNIFADAVGSHFFIGSGATYKEDYNAFGVSGLDIWEQSFSLPIDTAANVSPTSNDVYTYNPIDACYIGNMEEVILIDRTVEAQSGGGTPFNLIASATDYLYIGRKQKFDSLVFTLGQNGSYASVVWQYPKWNAGTETWEWATLTTYGAAKNLSSSGNVTFTPPSDWESEVMTINMYTGYFVRVKVSSVKTIASCIQITTKKTCTDLLFVDALIQDFRLRAESPCINAGTNVGLTKDLYGNQVPVGSATDIGAMEYQGISAAPTIASLVPASGPVGTVVTITGTSFTGATAVSFGGTAATSFTVVSATQITATVPDAATTGKVRVTTPAGYDDSSTDFSVDQIYADITFSLEGNTWVMNVKNLSNIVIA